MFQLSYLGLSFNTESRRLSSEAHVLHQAFDLPDRTEHLVRVSTLNLVGLLNLAGLLLDVLQLSLLFVQLLIELLFIPGARLDVAPTDAFSTSLVNVYIDHSAVDLTLKATLVLSELPQVDLQQVHLFDDSLLGR